MQSIKPQFTDELARHVGNHDVWSAPPYKIDSFRDLVEHVARLAYTNRNHLLFFRGQDKDYQSKAGGSTLYPAIYRGDNLPKAELDVRFGQLESAEQILSSLFEEQGIDGFCDISRKKYVRWSILQHYEVVNTPLLDVTQSLRVACSFAQLASSGPICYVYVLGFPYPTNRISINSEEDLVNIRLLSICPPAALRPYFQEGYMAGTPDVTTNFDTKTEMDFRNRLIAKFAVPRAKRFWNAGFDATPKSALYPTNDRVESLCMEVIERMRRAESVGDVGQLLLEWAKLEERLVPLARQRTERNLSITEALRFLTKQGEISIDVADALERIRKVRNIAAHTPSKIKTKDIDVALRELRELTKKIYIGK